jgi:hypothetical protein
MRSSILGHPETCFFKEAAESLFRRCGYEGNQFLSLLGLSAPNTPDEGKAMPPRKKETSI